MYPRQHVILGAIFSLMLYFLFHVNLVNSLIVFLSSVLIDVDHYLFYAIKKRDFSYAGAYSWHVEQEIKAKRMARKGIRKRGPFHIFHTIEFHLLLLLLSFRNTIFFYAFAGFVFHSAVDFVDLALTKTIYRREYFFTSWLIRRFINNAS